VFSFSRDTPIPPSRLVEIAMSRPEHVRFLSDRKLRVASRQRGSMAILKEAEEIVDGFSRYLEGSYTGGSIAG
jgi:hypothetical protein